MMRPTEELLKKILESESPCTDDIFGDIYDGRDTDYICYADAAKDFQEMLSENPLQPLAYAGIAYCKAKLGEDPRVVFDFFFTSLQFNFTNPLIWSLIADYSKSRADAYSWVARPYNFKPVPAPPFNLSLIEEEDLDDSKPLPKPSPPRRDWNRRFLAFLAKTTANTNIFIKFDMKCKRKTCRKLIHKPTASQLSKMKMERAYYHFCEFNNGSVIS